MKRTSLLVIPLFLAACSNLSDYEKQALHDRAVLDARSQPKQVHLAYLKCYALTRSQKKSCDQKIRRELIKGESVSSWDYIIPFAHESERLGFSAFLKDKGKQCDSVEQGPEFNREKKTYQVNCSGGQNYQMRFDIKAFDWRLVE